VLSGFPRRMLLGAALTVVALPLVIAGTSQAEVVATPVPGFPHAKVYVDEGKGARPVVVILHGADGGTEAGDRFGPILADMGYAAVGLPYYSADWGQFGPPKALPELAGSFVDIPVDQLARLREALRPMEGVDVSRFGLFGASKGAEFALIAASR
jgi:dienelactone hydrolase